MGWLNENAGAVQAIATVILVLLTAAYASITFVLARHADRQVKATARASEAQALLSVIVFLQQQFVRDARNIVGRMNRPQDWESEWSKSELDAASIVCSTFDAASQLVVYGLIDPEPFTTSYGPRLVQAYHVCEPYIISRRNAGMGPTFWASFEERACAASARFSTPG